MGNFKYLYKNCSEGAIIAYKKQLIRLLNKTVSILEKHNVKYMLDCGTLLGFYREGRLLPNDGDCDLFIFAETVTWPFVQELVEKGLLRDKRTGQTQNSIDFKRSFEKGAFIEPKFLKVIDKSQGFFLMSDPIYPSIDLFFYVPFYGERYNRFVRTTCVRFDRSITDEVETFKCQYGEYKIPKQTDAFLKCYYDDTWNVPIDSFKDQNKCHKYAYYGMVERTELGTIRINMQDKSVIDRDMINDIDSRSISNQKTIGILRKDVKYDNIFRIDKDSETDYQDFYKVRKWFQDGAKESESPFSTFSDTITKRLGLWSLEVGSDKRQKSDTVKRIWDMLTDKEKEKYKSLIINA